MKYGIIANMEIEAEKIIAAIENPTEEICGGIRFTSGKLGNNSVVVGVSGVGKVFAAMCAQAMIIRFSPDFIINTGVGGTLTNKLGISDVAVSCDVVQHDMDTSPIGDPVGLISGINIVKIPADKALADRIISAAQKLGIKAISATIASGDQFIADGAKKKYITETFGGEVCEMEGASVGQVCYVNNVPFCVVRAISDSADGSACEDFPAFTRKAADNSAAIVIDVVSR